MDGPASEPTTGAQGGARFAAILAVVALAGAAYSLLQSMVLPALPLLQEEFDTTPTGIAWVLTAYLLSASVATPILGRVGDMVGKRAVLAVVLVALAAGSMLAALATSLTVLIAARVVQGAGGAVFPLAFGIIRDEFPAARVPGAVGFVSGITGITGGLGVAIAGPIVELLSYHWLFWVPMILSLPGAALVFLVVPRSDAREGGRINVPAALALSGWLVALLLAVAQGPSWGWDSARIVGLCVAAVALFALWIAAERRPPPLMDLEMLRIPIVWWANLAALLFGAAIYATLVVIPPFLQAPSSTGYGLDETVTRSGLVLLPSSFIMLGVGLSIGRLTRAVGAKPPLVAGALLGAGSFALLMAAHDGPATFVVASCVVGVSVGLGFSALPYLILDAVPAGRSAVATGMNVNMRTIGGSIGSQLVATVVGATAVAGGLPTEAGYVRGFGLVAIYFALAAAVCLAIPGARRLAGIHVASPVAPAAAPAETCVRPLDRRSHERCAGPPSRRRSRATAVSRRRR